MPPTPAIRRPGRPAHRSRRATTCCASPAPVLERARRGHRPRVSLTLFVSSSAPDTDFTGKLVDVHPDGRAINLTDGILRARYRNSLAEPELLEPGTVYELTLDLTATSNVFLPGHRIRLEVSSSNFPRYDRNTNTGGVIAHESEDQMIGRRQPHPSRSRPPQPSGPAHHRPRRPAVNATDRVTPHRQARGHRRSSSLPSPRSRRLHDRQ